MLTFKFTLKSKAFLEINFYQHMPLIPCVLTKNRVYGHESEDDLVRIAKFRYTETKTTEEAFIDFAMVSRKAYYQYAYRWLCFSFNTGFTTSVLTAYGEIYPKGFNAENQDIELCRRLYTQYCEAESD